MPIEQKPLTLSLLPLSQPDLWAATILVDQFDAHAALTSRTTFRILTVRIETHDAGLDPG
jgi:hypothetical protein